MKKIAQLLALATATSLTVKGQLTMTAGDSYVFHFDSLQYMGSSITFPLGGYYNLLLDPSTIDSEDSLRMELFERLPAGTPVAEKIFVPGSGAPFLHSNFAWEDKEGSIRITAISGTFTINQIDMVRKEQSSNPGGAIDTYQLTVVPEPSSVALFGLGAALLAASRRRLV